MSAQNSRQGTTSSTPQSALATRSVNSAAAGHEASTGHGTGSTLLRAEELAVRWQVATSQIYRLSREGKLPTVRIGRYFRYRLDVVEAFEAGGGVGSDG